MDHRQTKMLKLKKLLINIGEYLHKIRVGKDFLNRTEKALITKKKIKIWTSSKLKTPDYQNTPLRK